MDFRDADFRVESQVADFRDAAAHNAHTHTECTHTQTESHASPQPVVHAKEEQPLILASYAIPDEDHKGISNHDFYGIPTPLGKGIVRRSECRHVGCLVVLRIVR